VRFDCKPFWEDVVFENAKMALWPEEEREGVYEEKG